MKKRWTSFGIAVVLSVVVSQGIAQEASPSAAPDRSGISGVGVVDAGETQPTPTPVVLSPFSKSVRAILDLQGSAPKRIRFTIRKGPDHPQPGDAPTSWTYEITDPQAIDEIVGAMTGVRQTWFSDYHGHGQRYEYLYELTFEFDALWVTAIQSVTFDLTYCNAGVHDFSGLESVLSAHPPGFRAQVHVMKM